MDITPNIDIICFRFVKMCRLESSGSIAFTPPPPHCYSFREAAGPQRAAAAVVVVVVSLCDQRSLLFVFAFFCRCLTLFHDSPGRGEEGGAAGARAVTKTPSHSQTKTRRAHVGCIQLLEDESTDATWKLLL